jgi:hypothetical protein
MIEELCGYLEEGTTIKTAATLAGISERGYHLWKKRGREEIDRVDESPRRSVRKSERMYVEFVKRTEQARRKAVRKRVENVRDAGKEDWRAAAWMLERMDKENWTKKERHEISGPDGGPVEHSFAWYDPDQEGD